MTHQWFRNGTINTEPPLRILLSLYLKWVEANKPLAWFSLAIAKTSGRSASWFHHIDLEGPKLIRKVT